MRYFRLCALVLTGAAICWGQQLDVGKPAGTWVISEENRCTAIQVTTGESPAIGVHLVYSTLLDQGFVERIGVAELALWLEKPVPGAVQPAAAHYHPASTDLPANSTTEIWLCATSAFSRRGMYTGDVAIAAANYPRLTVVPVTLQAAASSQEVSGILLILAGVFAVWLARHCAAASVARTREMRPLSIQEQRLKEMRHELGCAGFSARMPKTMARIDALISRIGLEKFNDIGSGARMPSPDPLHYASIALPWLERETDAVSAIVWCGALPLAVSPGNEPATARALRRLDQLNSAILAASNVPLRVNEILSAISAAPEEADEILDSEISPGTHAAMHNIRSRELGWVILALLSAASGWLILVNTDPGFGTAQDFLMCFLWGCGGATLISAIGFERLLRGFDLRPGYAARTSAKHQLLA